MTTASRVYEPNYALMVVAGLGGRIVAATSLDPYLTPRDTSRLIGLEVSGTSWYRAAVSPQARVVVEDAARDPLLARVPGLPPQGYAVSFSEPIRAVDGRVLGVWSNRLDWGVVRTVLHEAVATRAGEQGPAVHLYLLNRARSVIGSDRPVGRVRSQLRDISALGKEFDSDQGLARSSLVRDVPVSVLEHDARGVEIVSYFHSTGYSSYPGLGWTMLAAADRGKALAAASALRKKMLVIGSIVAAIVLLAAIAAVRFLRRTSADRARLESGLRHAQKMDAVGRLAGGIAHDFNNLLTAVAGHAEILRERLGRSTSERENVDAIAEAARSATALTRQLLAVSRRQVLKPEVADVHAVLRRVTGMLERLLPETIVLELRASSTEPGWVLIDVGQLEQVILNLVINARDAMPDGGRIVLEAAPVVLEPRPAAAINARPGPHMLISVRDTGFGMKPETMARMFEPFFTTKEPGKGTGFGLSTVYGIVKQHGGSIQADSEVGAGTTFRVYLPCVEAPGEGAADAPAAGTAAGGSETVLLIEDDDAVRRLAARVLRTHGYEVVEAQDRDRALELLAAHGSGIALVLTDVVMPGLGLEEFRRRLEARSPDAQVIYMSGYPEAGGFGQDGGPVVTDYLPKPFSPAELLQKVRDTLDRTPVPADDAAVIES
jgi:signal transduction histidine kinase/ActR/RegA family two-component response regulator